MSVVEEGPESGPITPPATRRSTLGKPGILAALAAITLICATALVCLTFSIRADIAGLVRTDLEDLQHQMTVFDADVYQFLNETNADHEHSFDHTDETHLDTLRRSFNGIAQTIEEMNTNPVYAFLHEAPRSDEALARLTVFVDRYAEIINGPDDAFVAQMETLHQTAFALPALVQAIKVETEIILNARRDARKRKADEALSYLTYLTIGFVLLVGVIFGTLVGLYRASARVARVEGTVRNRVDAIVASAQDAVVVTDETGSIVHFNAAAEQLFGFSRGGAARRNAINLLARGEARKTLFERMANLSAEATMTGHATFDRFVHTATRADGSLFPAEISTSVNHGDMGLIFVHFVRDISARLENERELKAARDKALSGEKAKSNFLAVMSHEIRTPLNGLLGTMSLLEETELTNKQRGYLANMNRSGQLLREHVDDVLDIARFEAGYQPEIVNMDLDALLSEVVENQVHLAAMRENNLSWQWIGRPAPLLKTDPRLLRQVLINLVGNAVKFTQNGGVLVEAELIGGKTPQIELRVADDGPGISAEDQARIFQDFERVDSSLTRTTGGTGLGLGIARRMTEALGGEIGVTSRVGDGSTFWIRFPYEAAQGAVAPVKEATAPALQPTAQPKSVLLVEDNEINRQVLEQMLVSDGHQVALATNGREGVDAARAEPFDLILMDVSMPVMDGPTAIGLIRSGDGPNRKTDIVVVTAHVMLREYARFRSLGAEGYLKKPIDRGELRQILAGQYVWPEGLEEDPETDDLPEIDVSQLETLLDSLGAEKLSGLLEQFYAENDELLAALSQGKATRETVMLAHKFAGSAAIVGAVDLHTQLGEFESLAKEENPEAARLVHAEEITRLSHATRTALREWLQD